MLPLFPRDEPDHSAPANLNNHHSSRVGSAARWALATILGTGAVGGMGYTIHRQNELEQRNGAMEQKLTKEQLLREGIQRRLDTQVTLDDIPQAAEQVVRGAVMVDGPQGTGSGWIIRDNSNELYIITNHHVTDENAFQRGEWNDPRDAVYRVTIYAGNDFKEPVVFDAQPVTRANGMRAHSYNRDLAVLHVPPERKKEMREGILPITPIAFRDMYRHPLKVGEPVFTIGNPFRERDHVAGIGVISNLQAFADIESLNVFRRHSAPMNPGNSGGPSIVPRREGGRLISEAIGMNTLGYRGGDGVGFASDSRSIQLELDSYGISTMDPEQRAANQRWWKEDIEPFQKKLPKQQEMPYADD
ncbi:hypothetical protein A3H22_02470 [Candidatus Peribacteria bacterium RIFCSPLOWO2_12_FULL_55_15]|nr:MAG: hypothetical protein A2789_02885 [Candidatus Peribacteria bacterium RIFCSPHIGHO2_01_FULL_54_22]OGJ62896.1 MAG: hypothetical protein A3D12_01120 [Candidatus Peribacteria bacterium RIFCSPHIGHO2_02_FULL_55_24]OGJ65092.1 MAG: hypothetical protein A3E47_02050 [Candidatus Peribacteria bacterium RIFCSPHIGHO2_12_FULL_54_10]OGJ67282.1 MAG: hypothetical protein A2947_01130 [Candidatus Peribacteria bacterium RIFCSPLOWO2_01_FULL_54_110]OGJ70014.1 MAG: hypothetical protein A3H90_03635 [Candidatus Pe